MRGSSIFRHVYVNQRWRWHPWIFEQYTHFPLAGSAFLPLRLLPLRPSFCIAALLIRPPLLGLGAGPAHRFGRLMARSLSICVAYQSCLGAAQMPFSSLLGGQKEPHPDPPQHCHRHHRQCQHSKALKLPSAMTKTNG